MKKLEINITKAQLVSFDCELGENNEPIVSVTIALFTDGGKPITKYTISTSSWQKESKFELPFNAITPMAELAKILEAVAIRHCKSSQKTLGGGTDE